MWTTFRVFLSGALRAVIYALMAWLKSEAGKFAAEYFRDAQEIVREMAGKEDLTGKEKFEYACKALIIKLKEKGIEYKDHWIHDAIQTAYGALYEELHKPESE